MGSGVDRSRVGIVDTSLGEREEGFGREKQNDDSAIIGSVV